MNNFAAFGLSLLFGVVGLVWFGGSSSKQSDSRAMPVSLIEHRKPELVSVNIEDIQQGDYVLAKDPVTGEVAERKVLQAFARVSDHLRVLTLRSESGDEQRISTTDEHPFFVEGNQECKAGNLRIGDKVVQADGQFAVLIDTHREEHKAGIAVYNFEVEGFHTYFVSAQGSRAPPVWVHNAKCAPEGTTIRNSLRQITSVENVHHIATHYGKWGKKFEMLFEPAGIGLHDPLNKVIIPGHAGGHGWYNEYIFDRLSHAVKGATGATYRERLAEELMHISRELRETDLGDLIKAAASKAEQNIVKGMNP